MRYLLIILALCAASACFAAEDNAPPQLRGLALAPVVIHTSAAAQDVTATLTVTDSLTGFRNGLIILSGPAGQRTMVSFATANRTAGTANNGTYRVVIPWPQYSPTGEWAVHSVSLSDVIGNTRIYRMPDAGLVNVITGYSTVHTY